MEIKTLTREQIKEHFPKRAKNSHKGTYGKNVIFASCEEYVGACKIAALGSLSMRMGSGYTALALTKTVANSVSPEIFECIISLQEEKEGKFYFNEEKVKSAIQKAQSVAVGMGMGNTEETKKLVEYLLKNFTGTLLVDADGLNSITEEMLLTERSCQLILTPHYAEFSRLTGLTI
ncbi:MAG: NAD(P)H-hydrate dehydratase, partial [Clostridia bacterium]|nr:NAD(P)H-hydrate dehydratase [Clostridia bacterium]